MTRVGPDVSYELADVLARDHLDSRLPGVRALAERFVATALGLLFPHFSAWSLTSRSEVVAQIAALGRLLDDALRALGDGDEAREAIGERLLDRLEPIRDALILDARAMHDGDPAARSADEVILAYPGFLAIATYRIAHEVNRDAPLFARLLTETAHRATGIDIHPGAQIGGSFAIDHGTGVVVGETAILGERVRLYQGVTLGAARVSKHMSELKRHPTIGDDVVIYANATILGGETVIGRASRIGGNVWLTRSVAPYSVVMPTARVERREGVSEHTDDLIDFNI